MASRNSEFLKNFWIPNHVLVPDSKVDDGEIDGDGPKCPVLVFVNSKSGGQLGGELLKTYRSLLKEKQVFYFDFSKFFEFDLMLLCRTELSLCVFV
jgi:diacylglycerol kinase (ATP)